MAKTANKVSKELRRIYKDAAQDGIWLREFAPHGDDGPFLAGAGEMSLIKKLEKKLEREIDIETLELGDIVELAYPGIGETREEACLAAIAELRKSLPKSRKRR